MRPGEPAGGLFDSLFTTDQMAAATSDRAWVAAMLQFEAALAAAESRLGLVPSEAADTIAKCCREMDLDPAILGREGRLGANPAIGLVKELCKQLPPEAACWAHFGATSQDALDSALMLVLRDVLDLVLGDLKRLASAA
ncbi:MAG TPA: hypothetical protein VED59_08525, partial [Acidimicrobiales bacterium]|nr:hypothetical protein [Acidimicrobiales bacterium]